jgi:RND family efflux transporter MFP subunit
MVDSEQIGLALAAKEAEANRAKAQADLAQKDLQRTQDLYSRSLISESRIDSVKAYAQIATETYHQLRAERDQLALDLEHCTIRAPFSGYTVRHLTDVGQWVSIGGPVIEMVDLSRVKVMVDLPERHFGHLRLGSEVTIHLSNDSDRPVTGRVTGIAPSASQATHTFPVIITADNSDGRIGGGMLVRTRLSLNESFSSLAISKDALVRQGDQTMVYTVVEGKASPIPVTTSSTEGQMVAVKGQGLTSGMQVVVRGNERIFPGSPVTTAGEAEGGASSGENSNERSES